MKGKKSKKKTPVKSTLNLKLGSISFGSKLNSVDNKMANIQKSKEKAKPAPERQEPKFCSISSGTSRKKEKKEAKIKKPSIIVSRIKSPREENQPLCFETEPEENFKISISEKNQECSSDSSNNNDKRERLIHIQEESESYNSFGNEKPTPSRQISVSNRNSLSLNKNRSNKFIAPKKIFGKKKISKTGSSNSSSNPGKK